MSDVVIPEGALAHVQYLGFKMDCLREQAENPLRVDRKKALGHYEELEAFKEEKVKVLIEHMPEVTKWKKREIPKVLYKKDRSLSANGVKWFALLEDNRLPRNCQGPVMVIDEVLPANPNSPSQVKEWLFTLGWEPCTYKFSKDSEGEEKQTPQIRYYINGDPRKGQLTDSVRLLIEKNKGVEALDGISVASHRMGTFLSMLVHTATEECHECLGVGTIGVGKDKVDCKHCRGKGVNLGGAEYGYAPAEAQGLTNTLRFTHRAPFVNIPSVGATWGKEIRGCIVAPEGMQCIGSDVTSLEDSTKQHYIYPHDPDYVQSMQQEGFDPHLSLAVFSGEITQKQADDHSAGIIDLGSIRKNYKVVNYSSVYGVGPLTLSRQSGMTQKKAKAMLKSYWEQNWAVKEAAEEQFVKRLSDGSQWIYNPVSNLYYSLRNDRDKWSTINQGTGVYVVDRWIGSMRRRGIKVSLQMHDEVLYYTSGTKEEEKAVLDAAMDDVNKVLQLNKKITVDVDIGNSYADVH